MLVVVVAMTILREGAEIILFVYSISSTETLSGNHYILGFGLGAIAGLSIGVVIYKGLIQYAGKYVFIISTIFLTLIAAGLASEAAGILTSSGIVEIYNDQLWDSSKFISDHSTTGRILKIIIGYDTKPNALQLTFYLSTIILTTGMIAVKSIFLRKKHV
jgi:high-affinity iron transporter